MTLFIFEISAIQKQSPRQGVVVKKFYFVDLLAPKGHTSLNKFYCTQMRSVIDEVHFGKSQKKCLEVGRNYDDNFPKCFYFNDGKLRKGRLVHFIYTMFIALKLTIKAKKYKKDIVFLSYDPIIMPVISHFAQLIKVQIVLFEHNTFPVTKIKELLHKTYNKKTKRICYTDVAEEKFKKLGFKEAIFIEHPVLGKDTDEIFKVSELIKINHSFTHTVFCPSASSDIELIKDMAIANPSVLFIVKSKDDIHLDNVITRKFYQDYYLIIKYVDVVYLPVDFLGRVSGPFYESLYFNSKVVLSDGDFYNFTKKHYPLFSYNDLSEAIASKNYKFNYNEHNDKVLKKILWFLKK